MDIKDATLEQLRAENPALYDSIMKASVDSERQRIEEHPTIGVSIVEKVGLSEEIKEMIRHHHERYDGRGYPDKLDHTAVSFEAYILGVADAFDAMTSDRPYRSGMSEAKAMSILLEESGKQFHPAVVETLQSILMSQKEKVKEHAVEA